MQSTKKHCTQINDVENLATLPKEEFQLLERSGFICELYNCMEIPKFPAALCLSKIHLLNHFS